MTTDQTERPAARGGLRFLFTPRWIILILACLAFAYACWTLLAPWQFGRNDQRSTQNSQITSARSAAAVPVRDLLSTTAEPATGSIWHEVTATGTFDPSGQVFVRLRQDNAGNPASEVALPFRLDDGTVLLVDRGYVPATATTEPAPPTGRLTITGRVQTDETDPRNRQPVVHDGITEVYAVNSRAIAGDSPAVLRGFIQLTPDSPGVLTAIDMPQIDSGPFLSYAIQWCLFGGMAIAGIIFYIWREIKDPRSAWDEEDAEEAEDDDPGSDARAPAPDQSAPPQTHPAGGPSPDQAAGQVTVGANAGRPRRRSRDGFDPSQLYDS